MQEYRKMNPVAVEESMPLMSEPDLERLRVKTREVIQSAVTVLLPSVDSDSLTDPLVEVWDYTDFPSDSFDREDRNAVVMEWLSGTWPYFLPIALLVFGGAVLVSHSRLTRKSRVVTTSDLYENQSADLDSHGEDRTHAFHSAQHLPAADRVKRKLADSCAADPETSASVIKDWLRNAA
jgi:flagellar biosynthesis/type III secretory pathway M-ring protein FliF/YscJ